MSETPNLRLVKQSKGDRRWGQTINENMDLIDAAYGFMVTVPNDLPEVYVYNDTFNGPTGRTITLPKSVDNVNEYAVKVTPTSRGASIGDIYVSKTTTNFVVKCSDSNTTDTFSVGVYYIGDVSSYGGSIYRRWYVSPSTSITDHANAATVGSIAWVLAQISTSPALVELPGNKTYQIKNNLTFSDNIDLFFQRGAIINNDFSIRDSNYEWYPNGATGEYYLQASGGGNPNINMPATVIEDGTRMGSGSAGSLSEGEWDWNDVNGLGYSTVYVKISGATDPDAESTDYLEAGYTISINGTIDISPSQKFQGKALIAFNYGVVPYLLPQWWGALADGVNDDGPAIQMAVDSASSIKSLVYLIPGIYGTNQSINLKTQVVLAGAGKSITSIKMLSVPTGSTPSVDLSTYATTVLAKHPVLYNGSAIDWFTIRDLKIDCNDLDVYGIRLQENYHGTMENVMVFNSYNYAYFNVRGQAIKHDNCQFYNCRKGVVGINCSIMGFNGCGYEHIGGDYVTYFATPVNKGGVSYRDCWFEAHPSDANYQVQQAWIKASGRNNSARNIYFSYGGATAERMIECNGTGESINLDGINVTANPSCNGDFRGINDASSLHYLQINTGAAANRFNGAFSMTKITDNGTHSDFDVIDSGIDFVKHYKRFEIRSTLGVGAYDYALKMDSDNDKCHFFANDNNYIAKVSGSLEIGSNAHTFLKAGTMVLLMPAVGQNVSISDPTYVSSWQTGHLVMGSYHIWVDATGDLRIKSGAPTSDTDGTIVGTQS